jgi:hypothetical protein
MKTLTYYAESYWNLIQRAYTGFQWAGYECETLFGKPLMRMNRYSQWCPAYWNPPEDLRDGFRKPDSQYTSGLLKNPLVLLQQIQ